MTTRCSLPSMARLAFLDAPCSPCSIQKALSPDIGVIVRTSLCRTLMSVPDCHS